MPEEKICPVVDAYIRYSKEHWGRVEESLREVYQIQLERFDELQDSPNALVRDPATQKLRAFYCLHGLFMLVRTRTGGPDQKLPLTREGIQSLIKFCAEARDSTEVKLYVTQLTGSRTEKLMTYEMGVVVRLTTIITDAAEYFRPRLATEGPLAGMGKFYAKGLAAVLAPSDRFLQHGRELLNISTMNRGDLGDG